MIVKNIAGKAVSALTVIVLLLSTSMTARADRDQDDTWAATWGTAVKAPTAVFDPPAVTVDDITIRQIVRISVGGKKFRVWFTNEFGTAPLTIKAAHIARREIDSAIMPGSGRSLAFGGHATITIPPGGKVLSDPVKLRAPDLAELAISMHIADDFSATQSPVTFHVRALQTNYVVSGAETDAETLPGAAEVTQWYFLSGVDVAVRQPIPVLVALGDSITDGDQLAAPDEPIDLNHRYTDFLAELIVAHPGKRHGKLAAVVNAGISGGQATDTLIGESALARLDRDVIARTGATHLLFLEGINDIGLPALLDLLFGADTLLAIYGRAFPLIEAEQIIAGHQQVIARAKAAGLKVIGATLTPAGNSLPGYFGSPADEKRAAVNDWIRHSGAYDIVIDFDRLLADPENPGVMLPSLTADGLHPNSDGYRAMAKEVYRKLFRSHRHDDDRDDRD
jgi:lysophospholipase L1-like esterase